jgi:uncharacterized glyoxalase superfamily protein PhnB
MLTSQRKIASVQQLWPLLKVRDVRRSLDFWYDKLGFSVARHAERDGQVFWCRVERPGAAVMHEDAPGDAAGNTAAGPLAAGLCFYFVCDDSDAMHEELTSRGLALAPPTVAYYGMKQLFVVDPDGYELCFENDVST